MKSESLIERILILIDKFRTQIYFSALSFAVLYLVLVGPYNNSQELVIIVVVFVSLLVVLVPDWSKFTPNIKGDNDGTSSSLSQRKRNLNEMISIAKERQQGALDAFNTIINILKINVEAENVEEQKKIVYNEIVEIIELMKAGAGSFSLK